MEKIYNFNKNNMFDRAILSFFCLLMLCDVAFGFDNMQTFHRRIVGIDITSVLPSGFKIKETGYGRIGFEHYHKANSPFDSTITLINIDDENVCGDTSNLVIAKASIENVNNRYFATITLPPEERAFYKGLIYTSDLDTSVQIDFSKLSFSIESEGEGDGKAILVIKKSYPNDKEIKIKKITGGKYITARVEESGIINQDIVYGAKYELGVELHSCQQENFKDTITIGCVIEGGDEPEQKILYKIELSCHCIPISMALAMLDRSTDEYCRYFLSVNDCNSNSKSDDIALVTPLLQVEKVIDYYPTMKTGTKQTVAYTIKNNSNLSAFFYLNNISFGIGIHRDHTKISKDLDDCVGPDSSGAYSLDPEKSCSIKFLIYPIKEGNIDDELTFNSELISEPVVHKIAVEVLSNGLPSPMLKIIPATKYSLDNVLLDYGTISNVICPDGFVKNYPEGYHDEDWLLCLPLKSVQDYLYQLPKESPRNYKYSTELNYYLHNDSKNKIKIISINVAAKKYSYENSYNLVEVNIIGSKLDPGEMVSISIENFKNTGFGGNINTNLKIEFKKCNKIFCCGKIEEVEMPILIYNLSHYMTEKQILTLSESYLTANRMLLDSK